MFEKLGGTEGISRLVDDFYWIMSTDPEAREVFATHSNSVLQESAKKLKAFLSGWSGGPQTYLETYGHPRLRMRHFPFHISKTEAYQWLLCMHKSLVKNQVGKEVHDEVMAALTNVAQMLINKP